ncbi:MAG: zinc finger MYND domain-containing protein [Nitrosomonas sp.]|nr:zinc finger MYND domain-containing protein [Nitrosomonas sp.]
MEKIVFSDLFEGLVNVESHVMFMSMFCSTISTTTTKETFHCVYCRKDFERGQWFAFVLRAITSSTVVPFFFQQANKVVVPRVIIHQACMNCVASLHKIDKAAIAAKSIDISFQAKETITNLFDLNNWFADLCIQTSIQDVIRPKFDFLSTRFLQDRVLERCNRPKNKKFILKRIGKLFKHCHSCNSEASDSLSRCSSCNYAHYCNEDCAKAHWPVHKEQCKFLKQIPSVFLGQPYVVKEEKNKKK